MSLIASKRIAILALLLLTFLLALLALYFASSLRNDRKTITKWELNDLDIVDILRENDGLLSGGGGTAVGGHKWKFEISEFVVPSGRREELFRSLKQGIVSKAIANHWTVREGRNLDAHRGFGLYVERGDHSIELVYLDISEDRPSRGKDEMGETMKLLMLTYLVE